LCNNVSELNCVFDAAALGQWIGGVDPMHYIEGVRGDLVRKYVNPHAVYRVDEHNIEWRTNQYGFKLPYLDGLPVVNLHVHSKQLHDWSSVMEYPMTLNVFYTLHPRDLTLLKESLSRVRHVHPYEIKVTVVVPDETLDDAKPKISSMADEDITVKVQSETDWDIKRDEFSHFDYHKGWYIQQILKLKSTHYIDSNVVLVIDADTIFLNDVWFFDNVGRDLYNTGNQYYPPYFDHMSRLIPGLTKIRNESGICHHMLLRRNILDGLSEKTLETHGKSLTEAFRDLVRPEYRTGSGASEYELYFNAVHAFYPDKCRIRQLRWADKNPQCLDDLTKLAEEYDYVSLHWWLGADPQAIEAYHKKTM
jgi:hypothetical protein